MFFPIHRTDFNSTSFLLLLLLLPICDEIFCWMMKIMNSFSELSTVLPTFLFDPHANQRWDRARARRLYFWRDWSLWSFINPRLFVYLRCPSSRGSSWAWVDGGLSIWLNFGLYGLISMSLSANHRCEWEHIFIESQACRAIYHGITWLLFTQSSQRFDERFVHILIQIVSGRLTRRNRFYNA